MAIKTSLIEIEGLGPVLFKSDSRCKRLSIRLKPFEGITVMFPPGFSPKKALAFVEEKHQWILKNLEKIEKHEGQKTIFDEKSVFRTSSFELKVQKHQAETIRMTLNNGILRVAYPHFANVADSKVQDAIREGIERAMRIEAKLVLPQKVHQFAHRHNFSYKKVFVKNLKSRWGSCSAVNNINLNLQLMRLPEYLIDYVVLHELCHTVEKNHGPGFWRLMDRVTGGKARVLASEMKKHRTTIY
ncbi:M48 family metallopeptidase [Marinilabilia rubra]|uniref:M48 family peptidase n=1 Tax=Marinilabilia rubra TaxID=2162893 RepID=A0A2U2BBU2_9BACT|nr:SprT family zinc-dependent metalloprotease [Marinilabilia rubra]PWE00529.1 M48 family peptidase [Marinilabilia rubra]